MVKKSTRAKQQVTADTRRSTRNKGRTVTGQADSPNTTAAEPVKSRPIRKVRQKKSSSKTPTTVSDRPRRVTAARVTPNTSSVTSTRHKRKRKRASTSQVNLAHQPATGTTVGRRRSKKVKFTQTAAPSRSVVPSIAIVQETQVASSVVIQDTAVPQVTTTAAPAMQHPKKRGRPPKTVSTVLYNTDSDLSTDGTAAKQSKKRGHHVVEEDHKLILKPKRRKGDTFIVPIPTRSQQICQVYAIGSNEFSQCGKVSGYENLKNVSHIQALDQFNIVDISAGSIHGAALTADGKVVTWGCNDHGNYH
jgi:hypothetical protein